MRFQVPQFIETETKLIGPFTLKQFLWLASGGSLIFLFFMIMPRILFFILAIPIGTLSLALAFVKINEAPLMNYVIYGLSYILNPKRYIFKKGDNLDNSIVREIVISDEKDK